jgi:predicted nucleic acid-binding protein
MAARPAVVIDASAWISYLLPSDALHAPTRAWLGPCLVARNGVAGPVIVLPEVAGAVGRRSGKPAHGHRAVRALRLIPRLDLVGLDAGLTDLSIRFAADLGLRGTDATYVAVAYQLGLPLVTWDQEQLNWGASVVQTRTP